MPGVNVDGNILVRTLEMDRTRKTSVSHTWHREHQSLGEMLTIDFEVPRKYHSRTTSCAVGSAASTKGGHIACPVASYPDHGSYVDTSLV
jgi:hypothetical protein